MSDYENDFDSYSGDYGSDYDHEADFPAAAGGARREYRDFNGKLLPTFEQEIKKRGFERFVVEMLENASWESCTDMEDDYEAHMLDKAAKYMKKNPKKVNLAKLVQGSFNFSGKFRAPALHWFLGWSMDMMDLKLLKHPSVTANVINALDNKGNSALFYCHDEHYQSGWAFAHESMDQLVSDPRFCAVDFPLMPAYGGGLEPLNLPGKKVLALLKRNLALPKTAAAKKLRATVNYVREGCSLLHMVCDEILIEGTKCTVDIHKALTGERVTSLKLYGNQNVGGLQFQMDLARGFQKRSRTSGPTVFKFVNSKGAVLDNDAKIEEINAAVPRPPSRSQGQARNRDEAATQVFTAAVRSNDARCIPASLVRLIRSHPEFTRINHVAREDDRGGFGNAMSHQLHAGTCLSAVLRKVHSPARAKVVEELLKRHPSGDKSRDVQVTDGDVLAAIAEDNGYPASIVERIRERSEEPLVCKKPATRAAPQKGVKRKSSVAKKPAAAKVARRR